MFTSKFQPHSTLGLSSQVQNQANAKCNKSRTIIPYFNEKHNTQQNNSHDLFQYPQNQSMFSETHSTRRESPIKIQYELFRSCTSSMAVSSSICEQAQSKQTMSIQIDNREKEQIFECRHKDVVSVESCQFCKGKGCVKQDDNIVKFFRYLIDFKLGKKPSYEEKKEKTSKTQVNSFCSDYYNHHEKKIPKRCENKNFTYRINQKKSQKPIVNERTSNISIKRTRETTSYHNARCSTKSVTYYRKQEIIEEFNSTIVVHENYQCDECMCEPIVGTRFHCMTCEDFDLCQKCYKECAHVHIMQKIQKSGKTKQLENMMAFLIQPMPIRTSIRPPQVKTRQPYISITRSAMA